MVAFLTGFGKDAVLIYGPLLYSGQDFIGWVGGQGGVTPIDSIVTAATAVGQWSTVKAAQTGATVKAAQKYSQKRAPPYLYGDVQASITRANG